ncbi:MAG: hypothetical protein U0736_20705 [Gemmataceae bacterium]
MAQRARATADVFTGGWTPVPVTTQVQEEVADDASRVASSADPQGDAFEVRLAPLAWPKLPGEERLTVRLRRVTVGSPGPAGTAWAVVSLLQGGSLVARRSVAPGSVFADFSFPLTPEERARITDYRQLRVRVVAGIEVTPACQPCPAAPKQWAFAVTGVTGTCPGGYPCAPDANRGVVLTHSEGCTWSGPWGPCFGNQGRAFLTATGNVWQVRLLAESTEIVYQRTGLNCLGSNEFAFAGANTCATWPATLTLFPV